MGAAVTCSAMLRGRERSGSGGTVTGGFHRGTASVAEPEPPLNRATMTAALTGRRVLVVVDQAITRLALRELLEQGGDEDGLAEYQLSKEECPAATGNSQFGHETGSA